jgi:recombination protein RecA
LNIDLERKRKLEKTVNKIHERWGRQSIQRLRDHKKDIAHIPTGFENLDKILGVDGLPCGRISEIVGRPSSGSTTLALNIAANFQGMGDSVLYFDLDQTFDAEYAAGIGVKLEQLVLIRPFDFKHAAQILLDLVIGGGKNLIIFEIPTTQEGHTIQILSTTLDQLIAALGQSGSTLIFISSLPPFSSSEQTSMKSGRKSLIKAGDPSTNSLRHYASVRLILEKNEWLHLGQDIRGYKTKVHVKKNKVAPAGKECVISIDVHHNELTGGDKF